MLDDRQKDAVRRWYSRAEIIEEAPRPHSWQEVLEQGDSLFPHRRRTWYQRPIAAAAASALVAKVTLVAGPVALKTPEGVERIDVESAQEMSDAVKKAIADAQDKLGNSGRLVIRKSGTEPLIRVMAEGDNADLVNAVVDDICAEVERSAA